MDTSGGLLFTKEEVPALQKTSSLLASDLAAAPPEEEKSDSPATPDPSHHVPPGFRVRHVIDAIVHALGGGSVPEAGTPTYRLHVVDDDGGIDEDFPELDEGVHIGSVGVDRFALCQDGADHATLFVEMPPEVVNLPAAERRGLTDVEIKCLWPGDKGGAFSVTVHA